MLITHNGHTPKVHPEAWVAPNAVLCGDVEVGAGSRILFGAQLIAEGGAIRVGSECIVLETGAPPPPARHSLAIGNNCLVGPNAHVVGCTIADEVFIATGASVFHAARLGRGCEVRINAVVHLRTELEPGDMVPIGWVAVGTPAQILPPGEHEEIWRVQAPLNFPLTVYGLDRPQANMVSITRGLSQSLASHGDDDVQG
jgi:carbonic anhydrase/acetyltransferase-like protein (isoleucine patch superfamily)